MWFLQVFLLEAQQTNGLVIDYEKEEARSYVFLIYPPNYASTADPALISRL